MNWKCVLFGGMFLVLAGLAGADYVSTSVTADGTVMIASSGETDNGSYASRLMTVETSEVSRSLSGGGKIGGSIPLFIIVTGLCLGNSVNADSQIIFPLWFNRIVLLYGFCG